MGAAAGRKNTSCGSLLGIEALLTLRGNWNHNINSSNDRSPCRERFSSLETK